MTSIHSDASRFVLAALAGGVLVLAARAALHDGHAAPPKSEPPASAPTPHHDAPGHEGHAHALNESPSPAPATSGPTDHGATPRDAPGPDAGQGTPPAGLIVALGNTKCPVMGGEPDGSIFTDWNGLRVGHCCAGCTARFLKNPEALLDQVSPDWRDALDAVRAVEAAHGPERAQLLERLRASWSVVREPTPEK